MSSFIYFCFQFSPYMVSDMLSVSSQFSQEAITSASSMNHGFTSELLDGQRKLLSLFASGSPTSKTTGALQSSNGPATNLVEVEDASKSSTFDRGFTSVFPRVHWMNLEYLLSGWCSIGSYERTRPTYCWAEIWRGIYNGTSKEWCRHSFLVVFSGKLSAHLKFSLPHWVDMHHLNLLLKFRSHVSSCKPWING